MGYPIWWDTTLTVYNQYKDAVTKLITWHRTVLTGCFWKYTGNKVTIADVELQTNTTICRIPMNSKFLERYVWEALPNDQKGNFFTLSPSDIIVKGEVTEEIDETVSGHRSTDFIVKYKKLQGCIEIQSWADNTGTGRNDKHYYVVGE